MGSRKRGTLNKIVEVSESKMLGLKIFFSLIFFLRKVKSLKILDSVSKGRTCYRDSWRG